jgi:hypothetical protein
MINTISNVCFLAGGVILLLWLLWDKLPIPAAWKTSTAGKKIETVVDISQEMASYMALTAIRSVEKVKADPKALECLDYLRGVCTAWGK